MEVRIRVVCRLESIEGVGPAAVHVEDSQARLAVGAEFHPARSFAFSAELAYGPWSLGRVVLPSATALAPTNVVDLSTPAVTREVTQAETMIRRATGRDPRPVFRFPYGARDARTRSTA